MDKHNKWLVGVSSETEALIGSDYILDQGATYSALAQFKMPSDINVQIVGSLEGSSSNVHQEDGVVYYTLDVLPRRDDAAYSTSLRTVGEEQLLNFRAIDNLYSIAQQYNNNEQPLLFPKNQLQTKYERKKDRATTCMIGVVAAEGFMTWLGANSIDAGYASIPLNLVASYVAYKGLQRVHSDLDYKEELAIQKSIIRYNTEIDRMARNNPVIVKNIYSKH